MNSDIVRDGYNRIAATYAAQRDQFKSLPYLERFIELLPEGGTVLDLGCGAGLPVDAFLVNHGFCVHGLDLSEKMIELARASVPAATYDIRDMATLAPNEFQVSGIISFYAIFHIPREQHQRLFETLATYLPEGGPILVTMGYSDWEGEEDFHGTSMTWSHYDAKTSRTLIERAGFTVVLDETDTSGDEHHQIIIASH